VTIAADKGYDTQGYVAGMRDGVVPKFETTS